MFGSVTNDKAFMYGPPGVRSEEIEIVGTGIELTNGTTTFTKAGPIGSRMWYTTTPNLLQLRAEYTWADRNGATGTNSVKLVIDDPTLTALIPTDGRGVATIGDCGGIDMPTGYSFFVVDTRGLEIFMTAIGAEPSDSRVLRPLQAADFADTGGIIGFSALIPF